MKNLNNILVLAAGRGLSMDGIHKLKLLVPNTEDTIKSHIENNFPGKLSLVAGYRAAELISEWPELDFFYNNRWFETGSSESARLGLEALSDSLPVTIMPCDIIFSEKASKIINSCDSDSIFLVNTENRSINALNVIVNGEKIVDCYRGPKKDGSHLEATGISKIFSQKKLEIIADDCSQNPNNFFIETIIKSSCEFNWVDITNEVSEINTTEEYFELWNKG